LILKHEEFSENVVSYNLTPSIFLKYINTRALGKRRNNLLVPFSEQLYWAVIISPSVVSFPINAQLFVRFC